MKKLAVLFVRHDADSLPPEIRDRLLAQAGVEVEGDATFTRTDPATPDEALVDHEAGLQEADAVVTHLRPDPLPSMLLAAGHVVTFIGKDGTLMRLKRIVVDAEPFFEEDKGESATGGDLIEEQVVAEAAEAQRPSGPAGPGETIDAL